MTLSAVVSDLVAGLANDEDPPAGGAVSAVTAALAASLVAKLARHSRSGWAEAGATVAQADALRARSVSLGAEGASAYRAALAVLDAGERSDDEIAHALDRAADVPLRIARTACDVALLAAAVSEAGLPALGADAAVAAALAEGEPRAAGAPRGREPHRRSRGRADRRGERIRQRRGRGRAPGAQAGA